METVEEAFLRGYSDSRCAGERARRLTTVDDDDAIVVNLSNPTTRKPLSN